ncbi:Rx, N-terminal [Dillenia turbinata]|uniref:Rx, N-terminal n=1 Tax=Dillenia turbinata TaxID=194707 RepID=A0AAN8Z8C7_9MAGN
MGEPLLAAYLQTLLDKLDSGRVLNFARQEGFESELKKWRSKLRRVKGVLGDAEEKEMSDREVKKWLDNLRDLAYDADDVLDELDREALQRHNKSSSCFANSGSQVQDLLAQIQEITTRFVDIEEEKSDLGLKERPGVRSSTFNNRSPTTSLVDLSQVVGRKEDIDAILKLLDINSTTKAEAIANLGFGMGGFESRIASRLNHFRVVSCPPPLRRLRFGIAENWSRSVRCYSVPLPLTVYYFGIIQISKAYRKASVPISLL